MERWINRRLQCNMGKRKKADSTSVRLDATAATAAGDAAAGGVTRGGSGSTSSSSRCRVSKAGSRNSIRNHRVREHHRRNELTIDPTFQRVKYGCSLIIGRSGSGKSSLLKALTRTIAPHSNLLLINAKRDEQSEYVRMHRKTLSIPFDKLSKAPPNSVVFIEDIIYLIGKEEQLFRYCLNYSAHHKSLKMFAVTHTIHKNKIFSTLPLFHYLIFTSALSNLPVLRYVLDFLKLTKPVINAWLAHFKRRCSNTIAGIYFVIDCSKLSLYVSTNFLNDCEFLIDCDGNSSHSSTSNQPFIDHYEENVKRFEKFVEGHPDKNSARSLFSIILASNTAIDVFNFTITFRRINNSSIRISVVDYIFCLLNDKHPTPSTDQKVLHNYLIQYKNCVLPKTFIKNKHFIK